MIINLRYDIQVSFRPGLKICERNDMQSLEGDVPLLELWIFKYWDFAEGENRDDSGLQYSGWGIFREWDSKARIEGVCAASNVGEPLKKTKKTIVELCWLCKKQGSSDTHVAIPLESQALEPKDSLSSLESMVWSTLAGLSCNSHKLGLKRCKLLYCL